MSLKKLILVLLLGGIIMMTACKKEEKEIPMNQNHMHSWKTSDWVLTKMNVSVDGNVCDEYQDIKTGQKIYLAKILIKSQNFDQDFHEKILGRPAYCSGEGNECYNAKIDGEPVIILKRQDL